MSRVIGFKDVHVAVVKQDNAEGFLYEKPEKLERSIKAKLTPKNSTEKIHSDDSVEDIINGFDGVDIEIELNALSLESRAKLQGAKLENGELRESKDDIAPTVAIGFKAKMSNGKYRFVWLTKGKFQPTSDDYETQKDKVDTKTASLKGEFYAREYDGIYRRIADETDETTDLHNTWFTLDNINEVAKG